jgi:cytochrome bd-type quinol oxidase subunit 2
MVIRKQKMIVMKNNSIAPRLQNVFRKLLLAVCTAFVSVVSFAQDTKKVDVDINSNSGGNFFASPWVWVIGVAVFILLLVALMRGGTRRDV